LTTTLDVTGTNHILIVQSLLVRDLTIPKDFRGAFQRYGTLHVVPMAVEPY
jgi:hypothetical protein